MVTAGRIPALEVPADDRVTAALRCGLAVDADQIEELADRLEGRSGESARGCSRGSGSQASGAGHG